MRHHVRVHKKSTLAIVLELRDQFVPVCLQSLNRLYGQCSMKLRDAKISKR